MKPKIGSMTPWGIAQSADESTPGVVFVTTSSHGGAWLDEGRLRDMRPALLARSSFYPLDMGPSWFEEDCEVLRVYASFPFPGVDQDEALKKLCGWKQAVREAVAKE